MRKFLWGLPALAMLTFGHALAHPSLTPHSHPHEPDALSMLDITVIAVISSAALLALAAVLRARGVPHRVRRQNRDDRGQS